MISRIIQSSVLASGFLICPMDNFAQDVTGPLVVMQAPLQVVAGLPSFEEIQIEFDESVAVATLTGSDVNLISPGGLTIGPVAVQPVSATTNRLFTLSFPAQTTRGLYRLSLGPEIEDLSGNAMAEAYSGSVNYLPVPQSGAGTPPELFVEDFESWPPVPVAWYLAAGRDGRVGVTNSPPAHGGSGHLELEASPNVVDDHSAA